MGEETTTEMAVTTLTRLIVVVAAVAGLPWTQVLQSRAPGRSREC